MNELQFDLKLPILYINPGIIQSAEPIEKIYHLGGLGFVDYSCRINPSLKPKTPYGIRANLSTLQSIQDPIPKAAIIPLESLESLRNAERGILKRLGYPVLVEVGNTQDARCAVDSGAQGLIARGCEGPGWVSETNGFVLLQEIIAEADLPVFLRGGVSPATSAGVIATGGAGIVLDVHLLTTTEAALPKDLGSFLNSLSLTATTLLNEINNKPLRVYSRLGTKSVRTFLQKEGSLSPETVDAYEDELTSALKLPISNPDSDEGLLPLSEDIIHSCRLAEKLGSVDDIIAAYDEAMKADPEWKFGENCATARSHGTKYPIVQGPMAHVSDNPDFLARVAEGGALPILAMGNMPKEIARDAIERARQSTGGNFGVGLIGLEINRNCYEAHLEIMSENPPPFAVLAAGNPDLAKQIEAMGTVCYLHCPAPGILSEALKVGLRHFVFEGCESGGHIGTLGSLNLWTLNLLELEKAVQNGIDPSEITVLFAGGIAGPHAAPFLCGLVSGPKLRSLNVGIQLGTAYLTTDEIVSTCAITEVYRKLTLESAGTVVVGRTVNTKSRAAHSPMASKLIEDELSRLREGVPLRERKELFEKDNLGGLRLASKGCAIDPETAKSDCPVFCDLPPDRQLASGLYLMGQVVSILNKPLTIAQLHEMLLVSGREVFDQCIQNPREQPQEEPLGATESIFRHEPIAVIGIGLRMPGSNSAKTYWDQITSGRSGVIEVPSERWRKTEFYYDPDPKVPDKTYSKIGGFIPELDFDPLKYRIPPSVAKKMDRTQQLAVVCTADALADCGLSPEALKGRKVGVIVGNSMGGDTTDRYAERVGYHRIVDCLSESLQELGLGEHEKSKLTEAFREKYLCDLPEITEDSLPGELANVISGRIANVFNLEGPNFTVDAACASSMAAVMNSVAALRAGTVDLAVTGGVDAAMHPSSFIKFCKVGALSPDGSRPFDEGANGFIMGEGAGIMILKRLSDAIEDRDRIYSVILDLGSSSDGRGKGITAPNAAGQERAVKACFEAAGIEPQSVQLIEAHGTSTAVGDSTELKVLDTFFRSAGIPAKSVGIGSVKSQIGHLKAAAGAAGMIKAILALYHKTLPPTINVKKPTHAIDWSSSPLFLITEPKPWSASDHPRRAGVSAFGFGGTNFHVIFQEYIPGLTIIKSAEAAENVASTSPRIPAWPKPPEFDFRGEIRLLGADSPQMLIDKVNEALASASSENFQVTMQRLHEEALSAPLRIGFASVDKDSVVKKLEMVRDAAAAPEKLTMLSTRGIFFSKEPLGRFGKEIALIFPGQGSQYPYMLRDLAERFPVVASTLMEADEILTGLGLPSVTSGIFPEIEKERSAESADAMKDTQTLQPMILTANIAILRLLNEFGIQPAACAGHSLGEYAACVAAGVLKFGEAVEAVAVRGREMARVSIADPGLMMSIPADARLVEEVLAEVDGYVVAANKNSPKQTVISGETQAVKKAGELFKAMGIEGTLIPVSAAFHSGVVAPAREPFMKTLSRLQVNSPSVPILSNVTGDYYPTDPGAPAKIRDLLGKQFAAPVEWVKTLRRLYSDGIRVFLECGPKRVMTNLTLDTLSKDVLALPTNHPKKGGIIQLFETLSVLAIEGIPIKLTASRDAAKPEVPRKPKAELRLIDNKAAIQPPRTEKVVEIKPSPFDYLLDDELRPLVSRSEFRKFLELQGESIRSLMKTGYKTYLEKIVPLENTAKLVDSEGMNFDSVVVSGIAAGLPSDVRFPFDPENLNDLILGRNFIKKVPEDGRREMLDKNVERLVKGPSGEADLRIVDELNEVIQLAGFFSEDRVIEEYEFDERIVRAMDVTTRLAIAAGIEALKDAGIPLMQTTRTASTGQELPDSWSLPPELRHDTGVIFASAFPGLASLVDEVTRYTAAALGGGARKRLIDFYGGLIGRIRDSREREDITIWFTEEFGRLNQTGSDDLYTFNRDFLLRVMSMAHGQFAQIVKAQGPNTHLDAACAGTTQAIVMARDWIRSGQAKRVIVIAADDVAGRTLLPWIGSGFLAMGAATTNSNVSEAALPFDDRRHGLILGSAAAGIVVESGEAVISRGMDPIASIEAGIAANSGYHGTRLDVDHISVVMKRMLDKWEQQTGNSRDDLAKDVFFMSHETYSPKRGGSSAAEIRALRENFGEFVSNIPIANTKGFTGHTMGVGVEDIVALKCLQKGMLPPIPNLRFPDPEFSDLNLSRGGNISANYALRLAAGFGSQIVMALFKKMSSGENRIVDMASHREWLKEITGYTEPVMTIEARTLRVSERQSDTKVVPLRSKEIVEVDTKSAPAQVVESAEIRTSVLSLLSKKTGYPPEMLDTGLDLEADLGIDTVKQAEFISEVREAFDIPHIEGLKIAEFPTIEHIINFVLQNSKVTATTGVPVQAPSVSQSLSEEEVGTQILDLLSQKTGYPVEMLDPDLDLEADLGIDTVKQAEFITEVRELFNIPRIDGLKIAEFPTIRHIIGFVKEQGSKTVAPAVQLSQSLEKPLKNYPEIGFFETSIVNIQAPRICSVPEVDRVLIFSDSEPLAEILEHQVGKELKCQEVSILNTPQVPSDSADKKTGIINLFPLSSSSGNVSRILQLYLSVAQTFDNGPAFLISVTSEDGAFGFEDPTPQSDLAGTATGAAKSFGKEYPDCVTRALDLHPDLTPESKAELIVQSIGRELPTETGYSREGVPRSVELVRDFGSPDKPDLNQGDVILATGGARGITASCLKEIAKQGSFTFVLPARTRVTERASEYAAFREEDWNKEKKLIINELKNAGQNPTPVMVDRQLASKRSEAEAFATIRDLKLSGCEVIYRSVDIQDPDKIDQVMEEIAQLCGRIDIVLHGAGIDVSKALKSKTVDQMSNVISVKLDGLKNLIASMTRHEVMPKRLIGFGSVSGRFGNIAQLDYSAANNGMSHLLRYLNRNSDTRCSVIDWAPWSEIGMATRGSVQQTLEDAGVDFIPPEIGTLMLLKEMGRSSGACEVLVAGRMGQFATDTSNAASTEDPVQIVLAGQKAEIESIIPGQYFRARIFLDPSHPLLDHHRINRAAVVPGVGGLEIMRSAAQHLCPGNLTSFEDINFLSPIKVFKTDPFEATVEIFRDADSSESIFKGRISSQFKDPKGNKIGDPKTHHECTMKFDEEVLGPKMVPFEEWSDAIWLSQSNIYDEFFHGPAFKFLIDIHMEASGSAIRFSFMDTPERTLMFKDLVPAAIEAIFQVDAALAMEKHKIMALPLGVNKISIYSQEFPLTGEIVPVAATDTGPEGRTVLTLNAFMRDSNGNIVLECQGIRAIELEKSEGFPAMVFESSVQISKLESDLRNADENDFLSSLLSNEEISEYKSKKVPKRASEWLAGRAALKRSIQRLYQRYGNTVPAASKISILQDDQGKPMARVHGTEANLIGDLSISHSNGLAVACAAAAGSSVGLGIDIEKVEPRTESWINDYFSNDEIDALKSSKDKWISSTKMWSLKEAALKAFGTGLRVDLRNISILLTDREDSAKIQFHNDAADIPGVKNGCNIEAKVQEQDGMVTARVMLRNR